MIREVLARKDGDRWTLASPSPGVFHRSAHVASWLAAGDVIGRLEILGRLHELAIPHGVAGAIASVIDGAAVGYGEPLAVLDLGARPTGDHVADPIAATTTTGLVFRAPTGGRYYGRSSPDKPPFIAIGTELATGTTVCLLEVMKTFNRVTYSGSAARVREILVAEGADVNAGDPLLALDLST